MRFTQYAAGLFMLTLGVGCATGTVESEAPDINAYIKSLPYLPLEPVQVIEGQASAAQVDGEYSCTTTNLSETRQYDKIVAYGANSESMWPGSIVSGDSVYTGLFTPVVFDRKPLTISVSMENLAGKKSAQLQNPSLSSYREALDSILSASVDGSTAANIYSEIEQVHSENQLGLALGVGVDWPGAGSLKTSFDWNNTKTKSRYVVRYTQSYYTVDLDTPADPEDFFGKNVTLAEIKPKLNEYAPPVYVSSITYGRMIAFTFESEYSSEEMNAALEFAYSGGVDVTGSVSVTYKDIINSSKITAFILGGSGQDAATTIDSYDALIDFIKGGGNYSKDSPGAPIAYKLAYMKDNSSARMSFTTDYSVKECSRIGQTIMVTLKSIDVNDAGGDAGSNLELYGQFTADAVNQVTLFNVDSDHYLGLNEGEHFPNSSFISQQIVTVVPHAGNVINLRANIWDRDGAFNPDDNIGNNVITIPFEQGWRQDVTMTMTGDSSRVTVVFGLTPI